MMSTKLLIKTKSKNYPIFIGKNILKKIKNIFKSNNINFNKCFIVVDKKVFKHSPAQKPMNLPPTKTTF